MLHVCMLLFLLLLCLWTVSACLSVSLCLCVCVCVFVVRSVYKSITYVLICIEQPYSKHYCSTSPPTWKACCSTLHAHHPLLSALWCVFAMCLGWGDLPSNQCIYLVICLLAVIFAQARRLGGQVAGWMDTLQTCWMVVAVVGLSHSL